MLGDFSDEGYVVQALTLHLEESQAPRNRKVISANKSSPAVKRTEGWSTVHTTLIACTVAVVAVSVVLYLRRSNS